MRRWMPKVFFVGWDRPGVRSLSQPSGGGTRYSRRSWFRRGFLECGMNAAEPLAPTETERRFSGVRQLYGAAGLARLQAAQVTVIGIGGVGSWAAEALARSAVGAITLVDLDHISESNTNRQIHALGDAYGRSKVEAMAERIAQINPVCRVCVIDAFVDPDNVAALVTQAHWVIDCIDQVPAKAALVAHCRSQGIPVIVCGAGVDGSIRRGYAARTWLAPRAIRCWRSFATACAVATVSRGRRRGACHASACSPCIPTSPWRRRESTRRPWRAVRSRAVATVRASP